MHRAACAMCMCIARHVHRAAARKIVDPIAAMVDEAERELAIGSLAEGLQSAARTLAGASPYKILFERWGHDRAAARKIVDPIAAMVDKAERELAIGSLAEGLQWAARTLTTTTGKRQSPQRAQELLATVQSVTTEHGVVNYGELNKDILRALYSGLLAEDAYKGQLPCSSQRGSI